MYGIPPLSYAAAAGRDGGCPMCMASATSRPGIGDRVLLLNGSRSGMYGPVVSTDLPGFPQGAFLIQAAGDPPNVQQIVDHRLSLYILDDDAFRLPDWFPPFAVSECVDLHAVVVNFVNACHSLPRWNWSRERFQAVIRYAWFKRLPVEPPEVWQMLRAHGVPSRHKATAVRLFIEGTELLTYAVGKRPIKRKRLKRVPQPGT